MYRQKRTDHLNCRDFQKLEYDEACFKIVNILNSSINIKKVAYECYKCDMVIWQNVVAHSVVALEVEIDKSFRFGFDLANGSTCAKPYTFKQHGVYRWIVDGNCLDIEEIKQPDLALTPALVLLGLLLIVFILYKLFKVARRHKIGRKLCNKLKGRGEKDKAESEISEATTTGTNFTVQTSETSFFPVPQIFCFQVFRGLVVLLMVVFRGESSRYWFLENNVWNGIMPADFLYPWFLWGVGAVFYFKYRASLLLGSSRLKVLGEVALRSFKYVVLGVCLNSFEDNDVRTLRLPGELQRCGVLHLIIFALEITCTSKQVEVDKIWKLKLPDHWEQYVLVAVCMVVHALLTYLLPVPGCPTGYTGPGGLHMHSKYPNCTGGAARYIDNLVFGDQHLNPSPKSATVYEHAVHFDSEGLLGTLNCVFTMFSGLYAAAVFVYHTRTEVRLAILALWGTALSFSGLLLCLFSEEGGVPLNKSLWSVSFALLTSGTAFLTLTVLHILVDFSSLWLGSPLFEAGLNTMLIYAGHILLSYSLPFSWTPISNRTYTEFVIMDAITVAFWIVVAKFAYKHNKIVLI